MHIQAFPYIALLGFLFGSSIVASRFGLGQFPTTTFAGLSLTLAGLGYLGVFARLRRWPRGRRLWLHGAVLGLIGTVAPMMFILLALRYQSSGLTAVLITLAPAITVVLAHFYLPDEPLGRWKIAGVGLALSGTLLLAVRGESGLPDVRGANVIGFALVLLGILGGAVADVYAHRFMRDLKPLDVTGIRIFVAWLLVAPSSLLLEGFDLQAVNAQGYFVLGYAALAGTFSGPLLGFYIIRRFGATTMAMTAYVVPIVAILVGVLVLGEAVTPGIAAGMAIILVGITMVIRQRRPVPLTEQV